MKCPKCKNEMIESFSTILITDDKKEECTEHKCSSCGISKWTSKKVK